MIWRDTIWYGMNEPEDSYLKMFINTDYAQGKYFAKLQVLEMNESAKINNCCW